MQRLILILTAILLVFSLTSCKTIPKNHLRLIEKGHQLKVAFIVSVPNDIAVEYTGATVFENRSYRYSSKLDFTRIIEEMVVEMLGDSNTVELYMPNEQERIDFLDNLTHERMYYWKYFGNIEEDSKMLSEWGRSRNLDYIAMINPGKINHLPDRGPVVASKGVLAGYNGYNSRLIQLFMVLFDVNNSQLDDIRYTGNYIFKNNPTFRKTLTQQELDKVRADWEFIVDRDYPYGVGAPTLESEIETASSYLGDDYGNLTDSQIKELDDWFVPHVNESIQKVLMSIGYAKRETGENSQ
ncbi:MAG: hypothetical protein AB2535_20745 [Candidatus Thiodiazotropha endolucinida]